MHFLNGTFYFIFVVNNTKVDIMGATGLNVNSYAKTEIKIKATKESRLRTIILNSEIKPISSLEYQDLRLKAYKAVR
jgi:hypothetical protein